MELLDYARFLLALVFVLGLIGLAAWLARRFRLGGPMGAPGGARRLRIVEVAALDARRKLVLVRRDRVEHLLLLGQDGNRLIETGITAPPAADPAAAAASDGEGPA